MLKVVSCCLRSVIKSNSALVGAISGKYTFSTVIVVSAHRQSVDLCSALWSRPDLNSIRFWRNSADPTDLNGDLLPL